MKFCIVSSFVPFVYGGARFIAEWLQASLQAHGHEVERFYLPFHEEPDVLLPQILAYRLMDLSQSCDRLICFRPPAHVLAHPFKIVWFIHHFRAYYDLWDSTYCNVRHTPQNEALRKTLMALDTQTVSEAQRIYTNSRVVADRLKHFNDIDAAVLYPPLLNPQMFRNECYGDEIVMVSRLEPHKRQHLLVEAMRHVKTDVRLRLCGTSSGYAYSERLQQIVRSHDLSERVIFEDRWITESEKAQRTNQALAVAYIPLDEDSYGYPSLEGAHAEKPILTTNDSGGVLELVRDGIDGLVVSPDPQELADAMDRLYTDRMLTKRMGTSARDHVTELKIDWPTVIDAMTR